MSRPGLCRPTAHIDQRHTLPGPVCLFMIGSKDSREAGGSCGLIAVIGQKYSGMGLSKGIKWKGYMRALCVVCV